MTPLPQLLAFAFTLALLLILSRWINRQVQVIGLRLTGSSTFAIMAYYLLMFPGILLHELSHFVVARVLGLRVSKFALGPRRQKQYIELGSVTIESGGPLLDSLVGLAPFVSGTAVLLLVGYLVFDVSALGQAWSTAGWAGVMRAADGIWRVPDFWVWAYVIFVVSNAMTPSPSDRQPWLVAGIYVGVALLVAWVLGGLPLLAQALRDRVTGTLQVLTLGFLFTIAVNLAVASALWLAEVLVIGAQRPGRERPLSRAATGANEFAEKPARR